MLCRVSEVRFDEPCSWLGHPKSGSYRDDLCDGVETVNLMITEAEHPEYGSARRSSYQAEASTCKAALTSEPYCLCSLSALPKLMIALVA
jgi:hypothetical protein